MLEAIYRDHFDDVSRTARRFLAGADHESVVQQVFVKLLSSEDVRRSFQGGSLGGWLNRITQNQALEYLRRHRNEAPLGDEAVAALAAAPEPEQPALRLEAAQWVDRFRKTLPRGWDPIFELCFLKRLDQRSAAAQLGLARTTLAYRCLRIQWRLRAALLEDEAS